MNENNQLKAFLAFLFIFTVMALSQTVQAAVTVTPNIIGYAQNAATGRYLNNSVGAGQALFDQAARAYGTTGQVNIGGKPLSIPAKLPLASNAASLAKNAMKLNPGLLLGTLAAGYLIDQGLQWMDDQGQWTKVVPQSGTYSFDKAWRNNYGTTYGNTCGTATTTGCSMETAASMAFQVVHAGNLTNISCVYSSGTQPTQVWSCQADKPVNSTHPTGNVTLTITAFDPPGNTYIPFAPGDWDALPDPIPAVGPELPNADYMPEGAPVSTPQYESGDYPVGEPYKTADGSTKQTMANVTNNTTNNSVTINTYETTIINSSGVPVPSPSPEPSETQPSECELNPKTIGCSEYGTTPAPDSLGTLEVPLNPDYSPIGGVGSCPADVITPAFGLTFSYQPICDFASAIKPFVLGFAWLSFAFIVAGTVRT